MPDDEKLPDNILWHQSGVNAAGEPFVQLLLDGKIIAQMSIEQARDHARTILEAAEASEQDAFILDWVMKRVGAGEAQAVGLLADFRRYRAERTGKKGGPADPRDWVRERRCPTFDMGSHASYYPSCVLPEGHPGPHQFEKGTRP